MREQQLAAGAAVRAQRDAANGKLQSQRPFGLDAVEVDQVALVQHRQVAALADVGDHAALSAAGLLLGGAALAQPSASADGGGLEGIVVTAQRRAENIQDVNIAITAFSADTLATLGWKDITQVATQTPNVDIKYVWGNSMPVATIRGIGMNDFQANSKPGVAFYVDEVYLPSIALMGLQMFDMERLEVLKGPQGTLYGRNTNGGAINYITRKPSADADAYVRGSFGRFDRMQYEGAVGGPLGETLAGRVSVYGVQQGKGHVLNRTSGKKHGEVDIWATRGQLLFTPSDALEVLINVHGGKDTSQGAYFRRLLEQRRYRRHAGGAALLLCGAAGTS